ncbi:MAG: hypothetical protein ACREDM_05975 [Methylocella sp.]
MLPKIKKSQTINRALSLSAPLARKIETVCGSMTGQAISKTNELPRRRINNGSPELESELKIRNNDKMKANVNATNSIMFRHDILSSLP